MYRIMIGCLALALGCADSDLKDTNNGGNEPQNTESNNAYEEDNNNPPDGQNTNNTNNPNEVEVPTQPRIFVQQSLDFGEVPAGTLKTLPLEISNGGTELTISGIELESADFELENIEFPLVLAPGQQVTIDVHLTPTIATERLAVVKVMSNDPGAPVREAHLFANILCGMLNEVTTILEDTQVGESYTRTVSLTNCSEIVEIHVTAFETSPNGNPNFSSDFTFSEVEAPFVLLPGEVSSFDVVFEPLIPGQHAVHFTFVTTGTLGVNRSQFGGRIVATEVSE